MIIPTAGGVSVTDLRTPPAPAGTTKKVELVAQTQAVTLPSGRVVDAWTFGSLPGPTLTAQVGETLEVTLRNRDIAAGVTLHWHGLSVPNGEDGVAGVTQDAVFPGETFVYRFRAEQPGTFWYHTHQHGREGIARGLYGALVVQPATGPAAGRRPRAAVPHDREDRDPGRQRPGAARGGGGRNAGPAPAGQHRTAAAAVRPQRGGVPGGGPGRGRPERADRA